MEKDWESASTFFMLDGKVCLMKNKERTCYVWMVKFIYCLYYYFVHLFDFNTTYFFKKYP